MAIFQDSTAEASRCSGNHEQDIAQYTKRNVVFRDGKILSDSPVASPRNAPANWRHQGKELTQCDY